MMRLGSRAEAAGPWAQIGIGGSLAAPPLPHHRAYGSVHGGSTAYVLIIVRSWGTSSCAMNLTVRASWTTGWVAIAQGPRDDDAASAARPRGTPRDCSSRVRFLHVRHCCQSNARRR